MKAAVLDHADTPLRVEEIELGPPRHGEVEVIVKAAGICHSDHHFVTGEQSHPLPVVLGHEAAGIVGSVGDGVTSVRPGDHVVMLWRTSCGRCEYCSRGRPALCVVARQLRGTGKLADGTTRLHRSDGSEIHHFLGVSCFAERTVCAESSVTKVPENVPLEIAALVGCAVMTGVGAVINTARVRPGSSVLVIGLGGVGLSAVMGAVLAGASRIVAADRFESKLEMASSLGATDVLAMRTGDLRAAVRNLTGDGVDYSFEAVGRDDTMSDAVRALRPGGVATLIGIAPPSASVSVNALDLVTAEKSVQGSFYGSIQPAFDFRRIFDLYRSGRLPVDRLLSRTYPLHQINEAFDAMLRGEVARSVVIP